MLAARPMQYLTPRRLLGLGASASLVAQVATAFIVDIDGVIPWTVLVLGVAGSVLLVLLTGIGILSSEALEQADWFHRSDFTEHRKWIRWFETERSRHGKRLDEHDELLARIEEKLDSLLANSRRAS